MYKKYLNEFEKIERIWKVHFISKQGKKERGAGLRLY